VLILNSLTLEVLVQTPHTSHTKFDGNPFTNLEEEYSDKYMYENSQLEATLSMPHHRTRQQVGYLLIGTKNHN